MGINTHTFSVCWCPFTEQVLWTVSDSALGTRCCPFSPFLFLFGRKCADVKPLCFLLLVLRRVFLRYLCPPYFGPVQSCCRWADKAQLMQPRGGLCPRSKNNMFWPCAPHLEVHLLLEPFAAGITWHSPLDSFCLRESASAKHIFAGIKAKQKKPCGDCELPPGAHWQCQRDVEGQVSL